MIGKIRWEHVTPAFDVFSLGKLLWSLVSGKSFSPLHYADDPEYCLSGQFPGRNDILIIRGVIKRCVVERESDCMKDADVLLSNLDRAERLLEEDESTQCELCRVGSYSRTTKTHVPGTLTTFCDKCGHGVLFSCLPDVRNSASHLFGAWGPDVSVLSLQARRAMALEGISRLELSHHVESWHSRFGDRTPAGHWEYPPAGARKPGEVYMEGKYDPSSSTLEITNAGRHRQKIA